MKLMKNMKLSKSCMFTTLGKGNNSNTLFFVRAILLQIQLGKLQKTVRMLLRQLKPFGIISHAQGRYEARGEVVFRLNILHYNFLLIRY